MSAASIASLAGLVAALTSDYKRDPAQALAIQREMMKQKLTDLRNDTNATYSDLGKTVRHSIGFMEHVRVELQAIPPEHIDSQSLVQSLSGLCDVFNECQHQAMRQYNTLSSRERGLPHIGSNTFADHILTSRAMFGRSKMSAAGLERGRGMNREFDMHERIFDDLKSAFRNMASTMSMARFLVDDRQNGLTPQTVEAIGIKLENTTNEAADTQRLITAIRSLPTRF